MEMYCEKILADIKKTSTRGLYGERDYTLRKLLHHSNLHKPQLFHKDDTYITVCRNS